MKKFIFVSLLACIATTGCGVKGDPQPPVVPKEIGRGRPTYKRAAKKLDIEKTQAEGESEDESEETNP